MHMYLHKHYVCHKHVTKKQAVGEAWPPVTISRYRRPLIRLGYTLLWGSRVCFTDHTYDWWHLLKQLIAWMVVGSLLISQMERSMPLVYYHTVTGHCMCTAIAKTLVHVRLRSGLGLITDSSDVRTSAQFNEFASQAQIPAACFIYGHCLLAAREWHGKKINPIPVKFTPSPPHPHKYFSIPIPVKFSQSPSPSNFPHHHHHNNFLGYIFNPWYDFVVNA